MGGMMYWAIFTTSHNLYYNLYHKLEGLAVKDRAIPVPGRDAADQDALDSAVVVFVFCRQMSRNPVLVGITALCGYYCTCYNQQKTTIPLARLPKPNKHVKEMQFYI
jgi:hypothetical protein